MKRFILPLLALLIIPIKVDGGVYEIKEDIMTDEKEIIYAIISENQVSNIIGIKEYVGLIVRCKNGKPSLILNTPTYNADNKNIGIRWDKDKPTNEYWNKATSSDAYFHRNPKKFIEESKKRDSVTLQWQPYQRAAVAAKFDLNSQNWKEDTDQAIKDGCNL